MALSNKQKLFIDYYLETFNATKAARLAGYSGDDNVMSQRGYELVRHSEISPIIQKRLQEASMSADEVLMRMADIGRSDIGEFSDVQSIADLKNHPKSHLVKKIKQRTYYQNGEPVTEVEIELHNAQTSLQDLAKRWGIFTEKVELSGSLEQTLVILPSKDEE